MTDPRVAQLADVLGGELRWFTTYDRQSALIAARSTAIALGNELAAMRARAEQAEAALSVVRRLPEKWRKEALENGSMGDPCRCDDCITLAHCADELEAIAHGGAGEGLEEDDANDYRREHDCHDLER